MATKAYQNGVPLIVGSVEVHGARTVLVMPLVDGGKVVGVFTLDRNEVRPYSDRQITLARAFAGQALIAVKNARLINETREALERQTATSELLRVIGQSPTDARPVFERIVETAKHVLRCEMAVVLLCEGDVFVTAAAMTTEGRVADVGRTRVPIDPDANFPSRAIVQKKLVHLPDWSLIDLPEHERRVRAKWGINSALYLPLLREGECIGALALVGNRANNFGPSEIAQAESFRDQAAIAIQNARLFNETQEALERQTATAEILRVISQSPTDARPVFERIVLTAPRVLKCDLAAALLRDGDTYSSVAGADAQGLLTDFVPALRVPIDPNANFPSRAILGKTMLHVPDWSLIDVPSHERVIQNLIGAKSSIYLPLLREDECIGVLALVGNRPNRFGPKEIAQAESFRDQALIAIENARLFNETQEALERQTATANVLKVISRSVSDATPVFETILESCQRLFGLEAVAVYLVEGDRVRGVAQRGWDGGDWGKDAMPLAGSSTGLAIAERRAIHVPDLAEKPGLPEKFIAPLREAGGMSVLYAPMLSEDHGVGSIVVSRKPAKPFSDREIGLVQSFADQAAIAIQNTRLFNETKEALEQQKASAEVLGAISKSVADTAPVFETILDACQRLFGSEEIGIYTIGDDEMVRAAAWRGPRAEEARRDVTPLAESVTGRVIRERCTHHIPDLGAVTNLSPTLRDRVNRHGSASLLYAPMLWEESGLGSIAVVRWPPRPFSEREQALLQTFADQAVIAIQNARLFDEVQSRTRDLSEALQQQTATAEVLKVISRSAFDLGLATSTILEAAAKLCRAPLATLHLRDGDVCRLVTQFGMPEAFERQALENPDQPD